MSRLARPSGPHRLGRTVIQVHEAAAAHGGAADINPPHDYGFMMSRSFADPDGHVWEPMWMDPAIESGASPAPSPAG